ncbi:30S ribosomal protein S9 [candidate division WWE3 bacterium CG_4_9_14_3_um_filter_41_6]|uniref:Small ribosomal subunit protein uS9 n=1 Tax=candidate division WWE3 bacterium CG_4_10_14_0_2_um_filter_41_14 TaxID=1975072 RepID=A0A2M7TK96_UNCKA|nr:MAG: 30S ribosomal protein S9 [candidate division WWE3 bacterium CG_4_10_14_0_2_um_filter_41_14]PJA39400.1 MAG: 30S ribosomal protein S9 [candidate division WWE3 bacterium CG_4_9_14_3_um_filter_41_6]
MAKEKETTIIWTSGRRKTAVARIKLEKGKGEITVNDKPLETYFTYPLDQQKLLAVFSVVGRDVHEFNVSFKVSGGGGKGQLDAAVLALAKSLVLFDENLRPLLKAADLLTRDPRMKERKKYGLKRARKAPQFSKR